jgi:hypothetical protein
MNGNERKMAELLRRGKEHYGVVSAKAEFEAEGTRVDELLRLIDIASTVGLPLTVKIGGCEAIRDLLEAKQFGARYVVAPMIESPYALSKYIAAKSVVYEADERDDTDFLFNIETTSGYAVRQELADMASCPDGIDGVVFGRSDFAGSLGIAGEVNEPRITQCVAEVASLCKERSLDLVMGGGVSIDALPSLREVRQIHLTRFETRKVVFAADAVDIADISEGLLNAVHFEMLWMINKRDYYGRITHEDERRIETLERRWQVLSRDL